MRLIDAENLEKDTEWDDYDDGFMSYSQLQIDRAPTIDAVPVVRCKDCVYSKPNDGLLVEGARFCTATYCGAMNEYSSVWDVDYCSNGKKKEVQE